MKNRLPLSTRFTLLIGVLLLIATTSCNNSDNPTPLPELTDAVWNNSECTLFLNDEPFNDASVKFVEIPDSEKVGMILSGDFTREDILIEVETTRDAEGNIVFCGETKVEGWHDIKVDGTYRPSVSANDATPASSPITINLTYRILSNLPITTAYYIPFDDKSGFFYKRDRGTYPMATDDVDKNRDDCEYISRKINEEIGRHLESLSFRFGFDGQMSFSYTRNGQPEVTRSFRYWLNKDRYFKDDLVYIENAPLFYACLLDALTGEANQGNNLEYIPTVRYAKLIVDTSTFYYTTIALLGNIHHDIFSYFSETLFAGGALTDDDKECLDKLAKRSERMHEDSEYPHLSYCWGFVDKTNY